MQYAGSEALKTDLTRTGKRTFTGMLRDLKTALVRYYKNNFCDGRRQDAIDLGTIHILRKHIFRPFGPPSPTYLTANIVESGPKPTPRKNLAGPTLLPSCKLG